MRSLAFGLTLLSFTTVSAQAEPPGPPAPPERIDLVLPAIELRPGVTADIHLAIYDRASIPCRAGTVLAIHGAASTARSMEPFALAALDHDEGRPVCRVITMDLPGHGDGPAPVGARLGELGLSDYAAAVVGTLERLANRGVRPTTLVAHSMGGMVLQVAQQSLVDAGASLFDTFGVRHAILLAPAIPAEVPWFIRDVVGLAAFASFYADDPVAGEVLAMPAEVWPAVVFSTLQGVLASNAPSAEQIAASGWAALESWTAVSQLFDAAHTPPIDAGIFGKHSGTRLDIVAFSQDTIIGPADLARLFTWLTGKAATGYGFLVIDHPDATHGVPQADPHGLLEAMSGNVPLP
ncbi:MAG: alpha/beta hydrolase [Deltaproteobacteria bacterium]|nr:alpha/beta hydrolase [Deltaproteobacteria bacterium]